MVKSAASSSAATAAPVAATPKAATAPKAAAAKAAPKAVAESAPVAAPPLPLMALRHLPPLLRLTVLFPLLFTAVFSPNFRVLRLFWHPFVLR